MPGEEIVAIGAAAAKGIQVTEEVLEGSPKDRDSIRKAMLGTHGLEVAANAKADRLAARQLAINRIMKPLFWFSNYQSEYFQEQFQEDLAEKLLEVPEENIQEPAPIVVVQAMEGLSFSFNEPELKDFYLNLIKTAADDRMAQYAHPSFASIIKNLTPTEARIIQAVLGRDFETPASEIRWKDKKGAFITLKRHVLNLCNINTGEQIVVPELEVYVDNWVRLGLISTDYTMHHARPGAYDWVEKRSEYIQLKELPKPVKGKLVFEKGVLAPTAFGKRFFSAVKPKTTKVLSEFTLGNGEDLVHGYSA